MTDTTPNSSLLSWRSAAWVGFVALVIADVVFDRHVNSIVYGIMGLAAESERVVKISSSLKDIAESIKELRK